MTITNNIHQMVQAGVFAKETVFTRDQFTRLAKQLNKNLFTRRVTDRQRQRANLALVSIQSNINRVLSGNGYYLKSRDYGNEFYVVTKKKKVEKEVVRYLNRFHSASVCARRLHKGLLNRK